jgi:hypothetical protein
MLRQDRARSAFILAILAIESNGPETATWNFGTGIGSVRAAKQAHRDRRRRSGNCCLRHCFSRERLGFCSPEVI